MQQILMPVCGSIAQRSVLIQPCDLRLITTEFTENVYVECAGGSLKTFQYILSFGNKNLSGLGELAILKNINQTSFVMQVALNFAGSRFMYTLRTRCHLVYERR